MRRIAILVILVFAMVACGPASAPVIATFNRDYGDGRIETLELHEDGRVVMNHVGYLDRTTLSADDVTRLSRSLSDIAPAADPAAFPKLTLTPAGGGAVVVATDPGTAGELFLSLLERHRLP